MENKTLIDDQEPGRPGLVSMAKFKTVGLSYGALRKECLDAVRQWPGNGRDVTPLPAFRSFEKTPRAVFRSGLRCTKADTKIADRAVKFVQREKRRHFHLIG